MLETPEMRYRGGKPEDVAIVEGGRHEAAINGFPSLNTGRG
jgi:hypothetical protein